MTPEAARAELESVNKELMELAEKAKHASVLTVRGIVEQMTKKQLYFNFLVCKVVLNGE